MSHCLFIRGKQTTCAMQSDFKRRLGERKEGGGSGYSSGAPSGSGKVGKARQAAAADDNDNGNGKANGNGYGSGKLDLASLLKFRGGASAETASDSEEEVEERGPEEKVEKKFSLFDVLSRK